MAIAGMDTVRVTDGMVTARVTDGMDTVRVWAESPGLWRERCVCRFMVIVRVQY